MELEDYASLPAVKAALLKGDKLVALTAVRKESSCSLPEGVRIVDALFEQAALAGPPVKAGPASNDNPFDPARQLVDVPRDLLFLQIIGQTRPARQAELLALLPGGIEQWSDAQQIAAANLAGAFCHKADELCEHNEQLSPRAFRARLAELFPPLPDEAYSAAYEDAMRSLL